MAENKDRDKNSRQNASRILDSTVPYEVQPIDAKNKKQFRQAFVELDALQNNLMTDYRDWAKEHVNYSSFGSAQSKAALKESNDAFTIQMLTNCCSSFQEGLTFGAILSTMMTFKMTKMMNPSFEQDVSRMYMNMRDYLVPLAEKSCSGPVLGFVHMLDKHYLSKQSVNLMRNQIEEAMDSNTLDSMVMTPRQIAALKVNFMEQYYVDMRKCDLTDNSYTSDYNVCRQQYEKALDHLNAIANNSGFDMSVVAEEERYIVGLKIMENPSYAAMFSETCKSDGAIPVVSPDGSWSGDFKTRDGHPLSMNPEDGMKYGTFTVRPPLQMQGDGALNDDIRDAAIGHADMVRYVAALHESGVLSDSVVSDVESNLTAYKNSYRDKVVTFLQDDYGMKRGEALKFFDSQFDLSEKEWTSSINSGFVSFEGDSHERHGGTFQRETEYVINREMCRKARTLGDAPLVMPNLKSAGDDADKRMALLYVFGSNLVRENQSRNPKDMRSANDILSSMRNNYFKTMSADDISRLLIRAEHNIMQGVSDNGLYDRIDSFSDHDSDFLATVDPYRVEAYSEYKSGGRNSRNDNHREVPVVDDEGDYGLDGPDII